MAIPQHKNPNPGGQIYNFKRTFFVIISMHLVCLSNAQE